MQKFAKDSINRNTLAIAIVIASLPAAGGMLALKNAKAPTKDAVAGRNVRARARDLDGGDSPRVAPPDSVRSDAQTGAEESTGTVRLQGGVPRALNRSRKIHRQNSGAEP